MRVVDRKTFIGLPVGTIFCKGKPWVFGSLCIKGESLQNDWFYCDPSWVDAHDSGQAFARLEEMLAAGAAYPGEDAESRDGCFDNDEIFLVYELSDLIRLEKAIQTAIAKATV